MNRYGISYIMYIFYKQITKIILIAIFLSSFHVFGLAPDSYVKNPKEVLASMPLELRLIFATTQQDIDYLGELKKRVAWVEDLFKENYDEYNAENSSDFFEEEMWEFFGEIMNLFLFDEDDENVSVVNEGEGVLVGYVNNTEEEEDQIESLVRLISFPNYFF